MMPLARSSALGAVLLSGTALASPDTGHTDVIGPSPHPYSLAPHRTWRLRGQVTDVPKAVAEVLPAGTQVDVLITFDPTVTDTDPRGAHTLAFHTPSTLSVHVQVGDGSLQSQPQADPVRVVGTPTAAGWTDWQVPTLPLDVVQGMPVARAGIQIDLAPLRDDPGHVGLPAVPSTRDDLPATATLRFGHGDVRHAVSIDLYSLASDDDGDGLSPEAETEWGSDPWLADSDGDGFDDGLEADAWTDPTDAASQPVVRYASAAVLLPDGR